MTINCLFKNLVFYKLLNLNYFSKHFIFLTDFQTLKNLETAFNSGIKVFNLKIDSLFDNAGT